MKHKTVAIGLFLVGANACTSLLHFRNSLDESCPGASREVVVGEERYCVFTCPGVHQNRVSCTPGLWGAGSFDGARVCVVQRHDALGIVMPQPEGPFPDAVCKLLPHGCVCSPGNVLCAPYTRDERMPADAPPGRCAPTDPDCGPEAFRHDCLDHAGYDPNAPRIPLHERRHKDPSSRCTHDGECFSTGCGYGCLSIYDPILSGPNPVVFTCEGHPDLEKALENAFCGCVRGECEWFEQ